MRLALVALVVAGSGAAGVRSGLIPIPAQMAQAISAFGGDPSALTHIQIKSLRETYDDVQRKIAAGQDAAKLGFQTSAVPTPDFSTTLQHLGKPLPDFQNNLGANAAQQTRQFDEHMQDLRNYARNPAGWHGAPP